MRKLATFSASLAAAVFAAHYFLPSGVYVWASGLCALLSLAGLMLRGGRRLRVMLVCLGAALGFSAAAVSFAVNTAPSVALNGEKTSFTAEVTNYPLEAENYTSVDVKIKDSALPKVNARLYFYYGAKPPELAPGDVISVSGQLKYSGERYGKAWDGQLANGIYLSCYPKTVEVTGRSAWSFLYFPQEIARAISAQVQRTLPQSARAFISALLIGDTTGLYDDVELYVDLSRAGVLHIISVSGMHVAFLVGFLRLVTRRKKTASLIGIPLVWVFAAVAGGNAAIVRAAFMQSAVLLAPLMRRESDGVTSLTAILAILLLVNPNAIASVGLQLSFSATLGIIVLTPRINKSLSERISLSRKRRLKSGGGHESFLMRAAYKTALTVVASFAASVGALAFSTPIMAYYFGCVNTYAILVNLLGLQLVSLCFILGFATCFLGMLWLPLGVGAGAVTGVITGVLLGIIKFFGNLPFSRIYVTQGYFLVWLIAVYIIFGGWYLLRRGKRFRPIIPTALALTSLFVGVIILQVSAERSEARFTAVDVGQGESIVISSGTSAIVMDCGGHGTVSNAGETTAAYLLRHGITSVDALCLTHFDDDHSNGVIHFMANIKVKYLIVAQENAEDTNREKIIAFAEKKGVMVYIIDDSTELTVKDITLTIYRPVSRIKPELIYFASVNGHGVLVTGDADETAEKRFLIAQGAPDAEIFVAGHHGSKTSNSMELLEAIDAETVVISVGYNSYGHPTPEALARFNELGMEILRTDELGNVEIILRK